MSNAQNIQYVQCGLIGYGAWGQHHARALSSVQGACLSAICAHSEQSAARARADYPQARVYTDHRKMLSAEPLDLCSVVLPSDLHFEVARDVLESGRHLLLEKPMALSLDHCEQLVRIAEDRRRVLAVGHELRMSSLWGKVKELIDAGAVGEPLYALIELWRRPYRQGAGGWRYDPARVGNWILEEPIHFFDLARWYFAGGAYGVGKPVSVFATANGRRPERPDLHDNFSAVVTFPRGRYAVVSQTLSGWQHHQTVKLTGTAGAIWASWSGAMDRTFQPTFWLKVRRDGATGKGDSPDTPDAFDAAEEVPIARPSGEVYELVDQAAAVVRAVRDGTPVPCGGRDGWWSAAMCLKAAESVRTGQPVELGGMKG